MTRAGLAGRAKIIFTEREEGQFLSEIARRLELGRRRVSAKATRAGAEVLQDCLAHGFLIYCRATQGKTDTPSWRITTGDLRPCALREPRHPATEVP